MGLDNDYEARRKSGRALLGVSLAPWAAVLANTAYALAARAVLGHYPQAQNEFSPNSDTLSCGFECLTLLTGLWLLVSIPVWYTLFFRHTERWHSKTAWRADVVHCLGWLTVIILYFADPVGFLHWATPMLYAWQN